MDCRRRAAPRSDKWKVPPPRSDKWKVWIFIVISLVVPLVCSFGMETKATKADCTNDHVLKSGIKYSKVAFLNVYWHRKHKFGTQKSVKISFADETWLLDGGIGEFLFEIDGDVLAAVFMLRSFKGIVDGLHVSVYPFGTTLIFDAIVH